MQKLKTKGVNEMRYHEPYELLPRKMKNGQVVWLYRAWIAPSKRTSALSTGCTDKRAAKTYCNELLRQGNLIPEQRKNKNDNLQTFADLAKDFWNWETSSYIKERLAFSDPSRPSISRQYVDQAAATTRLYLMPYFGKMALSEIKPEHVEQFSLWLRDEKGLSGKTVNNSISVLSVMLKEAYRLGKMNWNPNEKGLVRKVGTVSKQRGRFSVEEINALFSEENFEKFWKGHRLYWLVNYVSAQTGLRIGEVLALWDENIFVDHIHVAHSYSIRYGRGTTKTKEIRDVPISATLYKAIQPFLGTGKYVFSQNHGERPVNPNLVRKALIRALEGLGIDWKARNLSFHSFRHSLNSILRSNGIPDALTQRMIGHTTQEMLEHYTQFLPEDFAGVAEIQKRLFQ